MVVVAVRGVGRRASPRTSGASGECGGNSRGLRGNGVGSNESGILVAVKEIIQKCSAVACLYSVVTNMASGDGHAIANTTERRRLRVTSRSMNSMICTKNDLR